MDKKDSIDLKERLSKTHLFSVRCSKNKLYLLATTLAACGSQEDTNLPSNIIDQIIKPTDPSPLPAASTTTILNANQKFEGSVGVNDKILSSTNSFITGESIEDLSPYDNDELLVTADYDIFDTPTVVGIEKIYFYVSQIFTPTDSSLDVDLRDINKNQNIYFENEFPESTVKTLKLYNVDGKLSVGSNFTHLNIDTLDNAKINLSTNSDTAINLSGQLLELEIDGNGKDVRVLSSSATIKMVIDQVNSAEITSKSLLGDLDVTANGDVTIHDVSSLKGNIYIKSVGNITIHDATAAMGTLNLDNQRATSNKDITIIDANSVGSVNILSAGSIFATENGGFSSADKISVSFSGDSKISAIGQNEADVTLNSINSQNKIANIVLNTPNIKSLNLGGTSPIIVEVEAEHISGKNVLSSNSNASLKVSNADTDLSKLSNSVSLWLSNLDGKTVTVGEGQKYFLDTETPQTATISALTLDHFIDAKTSTNNSVIISTRDTDSTNSDKVANVAGINLIDLQTLKIDLSSGSNIAFSKNIVGVDLKKVIIEGTGNFDLSDDTIIGNKINRVELDGTSAEGFVRLSIGSAEDSISKVVAGSANDYITVNGVTSDSNGIIIDGNKGDDTVRVTLEGDGPGAKIDYNGGEGLDTLELDIGVNLSAANLTITSIEKITLSSGGAGQKLAASDVSAKSITISKIGSETSSLTIFADQSSLDLSKLTFDSTFSTENDSIIVDASKSQSGVNVTGANVVNFVTGSHADDTIKGSVANDIISSGTGDDIIDGLGGADLLTGGAGDDRFDISSGTSTIAKMDKITDYQAAKVEKHNDTINNITGTKAADVAGIDVKSAISSGLNSHVATATVTNGIMTLGGTNSGLIDTLDEWIASASTPGVISKAADDSDAVGTLAFQFEGNTYLIESNDTFNNNTPNVEIVSIIELTGLTGASKVDTDAADGTILIA